MDVTSRDFHSRVSACDSSVSLSESASTLYFQSGSEFQRSFYRRTRTVTVYLKNFSSMSQKAKPTKQTGGTDIRSFFGGGGARVGGGSTSNVNASQSTSQLRTQQLTKPTTPSKHFGLKVCYSLDVVCKAGIRG